MASVSCSTLLSSVFLMFEQKREWQSLQSDLLNRCAIYPQIYIYISLPSSPYQHSKYAPIPPSHYHLSTLLDNKIIMPKYADLSDDSDDERAKKKQPPLQVRLQKNKLDNVDPSQIIVNLSRTHYDIIDTVVEELGWTTTQSKKKQNWDIMWTDSHIEVHDLFRLNVQQKISHYPAIYVLAKKNFLGRGLMKMAKAFPNEYDFFPQTWILPSDMGQLMRFDSQCQPENKPIYIFKPDAGCQGKGISLFTKLQEVQDKAGIVQTYINNPLLVDGLKFDLRIYVLIYGCDPVRIYRYEEGLARFATEPYQKARKRNLKDNYIHLTNYAINKNNKKFIFNTSDKQMHVGHKRSLSAVLSFLAARGIDMQELNKKIDRMIVKTLLVGKPTLQHMYGLSQKDDMAKDHCFQILGFDVMLDDQMEPMLLEVNHTPSFATDTPLDRTIKKQLIKETLLLLNVNPETKKARVEQKLQEEERRSQRKQTKLNQEERDRLKKMVQLEKDQHDSKILMKYHKIFPVQGKEYRQMELYAVRVFNQQSGFKNKEFGKDREKSKKLIGKRPASLEHMPSPSKVKGENKSNKEQEDLQKLPNISPKKGGNIILSPEAKAALKTGKGLDMNSPTMVRAARGEKLRARLNIIEESGFEKRNDGREGNFLEPKIMQISNISKESTKPGKGKSIELKLELTEGSPSTRKNFTQFMGLSSRQKNMMPGDKNSIVVVKKDRARSYREPPRRRLAESVNLFDDLSQELMVLKAKAGLRRPK